MSQARDQDAIAALPGLGHLASAVGHHVINAFSAIVSNAEVLRQLAQSPGSIDYQGAADTIIRSAVDASGVARRLIDYSRAPTAPGEASVALDRLVAAV